MYEELYRDVSVLILNRFSVLFLTAQCTVLNRFEATVYICDVDDNVSESKQPIDELKKYGRLGPDTVMFNYSGCAGIIIVEADRLGVSNIFVPPQQMQLIVHLVVSVCLSVLFML